MSNIIRKIRLMNKLTQKQFADMVGVSRMTEIKWEKDCVYIRKKHRDKISSVFGIDAKELAICENPEMNLIDIPKNDEEKKEFIESLMKKWRITI